MVTKLLSYVSFQSFIILSFTFMSMIHYKLSFIYGQMYELKYVCMYVLQMDILLFQQVLSTQLSFLHLIVSAFLLKNQMTRLSLLGEVSILYLVSPTECSLILWENAWSSYLRTLKINATRKTR